LGQCIGTYIFDLAYVQASAEAWVEIVSIRFPPSTSRGEIIIKITGLLVNGRLLYRAGLVSIWGSSDQDLFLGIVTELN
jgi:hypothetical protein